MTAEERWRALRLIVGALIPSGPGRPSRKSEAFGQVLEVMDALERSALPGPTCLAPAPAGYVVQGRDEVKVYEERGHR